MKIQTHEPQKADIDMTPLIDCVFLLILFFILTTKITVQIEEVELPIALEGRPQEEGSPDIVQPLIINIVLDPRGEKKGRGERAGLIRFNGQSLTKDELTKKLLFEAKFDGDPKPIGRGHGYEPSADGRNLSKLKVLVRGDRNVRGEFAQRVLEACAKAGIYKTVISSVEPE